MFLSWLFSANFSVQVQENQSSSNNFQVRKGCSTPAQVTEFSTLKKIIPIQDLFLTALAKAAPSAED
jgi:hypothetical protein